MYNIDFIVYETWIYRYCNRIYHATQDIYLFGIKTREKRINELKQFDVALAHSRKEAQMLAIELVDKFLNEKNDFHGKTKDNFRLMSNSLSDSLNEQNCEKNHYHRHIDKIDEQYSATIDSIWYALMELETTLHERIIESKKIFDDTILRIIENFITKSNKLFDCIRLACDEYFRLNRHRNNNDSDTIAVTKDHHMNIINSRMDNIESQANKWLSKVMDKYEQ